MFEFVIDSNSFDHARFSELSGEFLFRRLHESLNGAFENGTLLWQIGRRALCGVRSDAAVFSCVGLSSSR
jgi:hypothetical protein